jgi:hypothetical protein
MWHDTCTQGNRVDFLLLVVGSQIANLTIGPSFDHNLCFKCPNGSCEPISNIYVLKSFQWYKECLNPMSFDPCNRFLKIWESIGTPIPKVRVPLEMWGFIPSHSFCTLESMKCASRASLLARTLASPCLGRSPRLGLRQNHAQLWFVLINIIIVNVFSWVVLLLLLIIIKLFETWVCNLRLLCL